MKNLAIMACVNTI